MRYGNLTEIDLHNPPDTGVRDVVDRMRLGGLVAFPTSASFALGGTTDNYSAKERMALMRRLGKRHNFTLMCRDFAEMAQFVRFDGVNEELVSAVVPAPYTFILPPSRRAPKDVVNIYSQTLAVRVDAHPIAQAILSKMGGPMLTATLIDPGWEAVFTSAEEVEFQVGPLIDEIVDDVEIEPRPTTVVDLTRERPIIVRIGAGDPTPFMQ